MFVMVFNIFINLPIYTLSNRSDKLMMISFDHNSLFIEASE